MHVRISENDIKDIFAFKDKTERGMLKIEFMDKDTTDKIMRAKKSVDLNMKEFGGDENHRIYYIIYINHDLTKENQQLFKRICDYKRENRLKYAWFNYGNFFIRKDEKSKCITIRNEDLNTLTSKNI